MLNTIHIFLTKKLTILISYILINPVAKLVFDERLHDDSNEAIFVISTLVFYMILAFATYRNIKFAAWLMAFCLLFTGIAGFIQGIFIVSLTQYVLKAYFIITGTYFTYGGFFLIFPNWKIFKTRSI